MSYNMESVLEGAISLGIDYARAIDRIIASDCDYSPALVKVVRLIASRGGSALQKDLSDTFAITMAAMSQSVDALVKAGLVTREDWAGDKRQRMLTLTPEGAALAKKVDRDISRYFRRIGSYLSRSEIDQLGSILSKLDKLREINGDPTNC